MRYQTRLDSGHRRSAGCKSAASGGNLVAEIGLSHLLVRLDCLRSEEHTSELQSQSNLVCRLLLEKKKNLPHDRTHQHQDTPADQSQCILPPNGPPARPTHRARPSTRLLVTAYTDEPHTPTSTPPV